MPFTLAHPGFVFPLKKWAPHLISMEALVIGSFVPDFDIIFRFTENRFHLFTFTPLNILFIIFPFSILTWFAYLLFIKKTITYIFNLPYTKTNFKDIATLKSVAFSFFIAIIVHLVLDFFAHPNAYIWAKTFSEYFNHTISFDTFFIFFLYFPLVFFSLLGFYLMYLQLIKTNLITKEIVAKWFVAEKKIFWVVFAITAFLVFILKIKFNGIEAFFSFDSIILYALSSFFYGIIFSALLFNYPLKTLKDHGQ